jgi:hypothetical protein
MFDPFPREQLWLVLTRAGEIRCLPAAWQALAEVAGSRFLSVAASRGGQLTKQAAQACGWPV